MPIGYPTEKYGPLTRKPVAEVTYADTWAPPGPSRRWEIMRLSRAR